MVVVAYWLLVAAALLAFWRWLAAPARRAQLGTWGGTRVAAVWLAALVLTALVPLVALERIAAGSQLAFALTMVGLPVTWGCVAILTWTWSRARAAKRP